MNRAGGARQESLNRQLAELERLLHEMGFAGLASTAAQLRQRLDEGPFRLAVLGQFKRGKSTLLNALLHEPLLPMGILPLTSIPTTLRYGPERCVRVTFEDGRCKEEKGPLEYLQHVLARYVSEQDNPGNRLGVRRVTVDHPARLLANGLEMTDTPGIGSTLLHNTRTAQQALPACDGALFVLSPDPPITDAELQFLACVRDATTRIIFVLTKADVLPPAERAHVLTFLQGQLREKAALADHARLFVVSARHALEPSPPSGEAPDDMSGLEGLESSLTEFLLTEKRAALQDAISAKAARVVEEAFVAVDLERQLLALPREDLERRADRFDAHLDRMERERVSFRDRLSGDRHRLLAELDRLAEALIEPATKALSSRVERVRREAGQRTGRNLSSRLDAALSEEVTQAFDHAAKEVWAVVTDQFHRLQDIHCREMDTLIHRVRCTAADLFEVPCLEGVALDRVEAVRDPRVIGHRWVTSFIEEAGTCLSRLLPQSWQATRFDRRLQHTIDYLIARNVGELRWTMRQNLDDALRLFQTRMETQLEAVIGSIRKALRAAQDRQALREAARTPELHRLDGFRTGLQHLREAFAFPGQPRQSGPLV